MMDIANLAIRIILLNMLGIASETAFYKKLWGLGTFCLSIWITVFRLSFLRAVAIFVGVFGHTGERAMATSLYQNLSNANFATITDVLILIGTFVMLKDVYFHLKGARVRGVSR